MAADVVRALLDEKKKGTSLSKLKKLVPELSEAAVPNQFSTRVALLEYEGCVGNAVLDDPPNTVSDALPFAIAKCVETKVEELWHLIEAE
jgi:hypothetical protein